MNAHSIRPVTTHTIVIVPRFTARFMITSTWLVVGVLLIGFDAGLAQDASPKPGNWIRLLDGKSLSGWKITEFGGEGEVTVEGDGRIVLPTGSPLTGVTYKGPINLPTFDYEICLQARRVEGNDFFCGLTFPYGDSHCSLILGGWGGGLVGLSSLAGMDASENETTSYQSFEKRKWYDVRLQVRKGSIYAWIDDKQTVVCAVRDRPVTTRPEVLRSKPLGIASFQTAAEFREVKLRALPPNAKTESRDMK